MPLTPADVQEPKAADKPSAVFRRDQRYLQDLLLARPDTFQAADRARVEALGEQYLAAGEGGMVCLCRSILDVDRRRVAHVEADRHFLNGVIAGALDPLQDGLFDRMEPMFAAYADEPGMTALLNQAARTFGDAVQAAATELVARLEAEGITPPGRSPMEPKSSCLLSK
ncbi:hypothetical protein AB4Z46_04730 [Variovorax sp. M-6]|uniref:hypothetical protein n=1 Tax=Variovorax sp. M-6 TaxID=3233041 RepID=UPI003F979B7C